MNQWNYKPFWEETYKQLKKKLNESEITLWIDALSYYDSKENIIVFSVGTPFIRDQIAQKYQRLIEDTFLEISDMNISLEFVVISKNIQTTQEKKLPPVKPSSPETQKKIKKNHPNLNKNYTFDNFIVGDNNDYAANAAQVITKNLGKNYNPFLIYGGVGLGKTHLMQAIGHEIWNNTNLTVIYVTAESFTNEFISSLKQKKVMGFKNKYRSADVLLIDDIHFFQGKEGVQEELFHTFNTLYESERQIVFTCDRNPSDLKSLSSRLKSRFERGLNIDLKTPKYETRCAILIKKLENSPILIPQDVINLVAQNISSNVRDLEAAMTKLIAFAEIKNKPMTIEIAKDLLRDTFGSTRQHNISVQSIQKIVANYFDISLSDIRGKKRTKSITFPRHIAMYLSREMTENSTTELGIEFGGKDHSTILNGYQKISERILAEPSLEVTITELKKIIMDNYDK